MNDGTIKNIGMKCARKCVHEMCVKRMGVCRLDEKGTVYRYGIFVVGEDQCAESIKGRG